MYAKEHIVVYISPTLRAIVLVCTVRYHQLHTGKELHHYIYVSMGQPLPYFRAISDISPYKTDAGE